MSCFQQLLQMVRGLGSRITQLHAPHCILLRNWNDRQEASRSGRGNCTVELRNVFLRKYFRVWYWACFFTKNTWRKWESKDGLAGEHGGPKPQFSFLLSLSGCETPQKHLELKYYLSLCVKVIFQAISILVFTSGPRVSPKLMPGAIYSRDLPARWTVFYFETASLIEY